MPYPALAKAFEKMVLEAGYPCVSAKAAQHKGQMDIFCTGNMLCPDNDNAITQTLQNFAARHDREKLFVSQVVLFDGPTDLNDQQFESALWQRLGGIHKHDKQKFAWDPAVNPDPTNAHFSMSVGGRGFYVVGLHPHAARASRRFQSPALVFNLHSQFEQLRATGEYKGIRDATLARDRELCGSDNAMLKSFGEASEAAQYSGRQHEGLWRCPFTGKFAP